MQSVLANLILDVSDLDRSLGFYQGLLGLPVCQKQSVEGHRLAYLSTGGTKIMLLEQPKEDQNPQLDRSGGMVIKFYVEGLPGLASSVALAGVVVLRELDSPPVGERTLLVRDPDGYAVLLSERVETLH